MIADYHRYQAEHTTMESNQFEVMSKGAIDYYRKALQVARTDLNPSNPVLLGIALNLSIMHSDILGNRDLAMEVSNLVTKEAEDHIEDFEGEDDFTDSRNLIATLKENL